MITHDLARRQRRALARCAAAALPAAVAALLIACDALGNARAADVESPILAAPPATGIDAGR